MKEFDDIFRKKLEHHTSVVSDDNWNKIAQQLPKAKNAVRPVWFASLLAIAVLTVTSLAVYLSFKDSVIDNNQLAVENDNVTASYSDYISQNLSTHSEITLQKSEILKINDRSTNFKPESKTPQKNQTYTVEFESLSPYDFPQATHQNINSPISSGIYKDPFIENITEETADKSGIRDVESIVSAHLNISVSDQKIDVPYKEVKSIENQKIAYAAPLRHSVSDKEVCSFIWRGYQKSLDFYYSSDFVDMKIAGPDNFREHIDMRNATETTVYSHSAGVRLGYNIGYRWNLHTGINFSQLNQRFQYTDPEANEPRTEIIRQYIYSNGQLVDSTFTEKTEYLPGSKYHKIYNRYTTWDIPVLGRYTLAANNRLSISAMAGVFLNVSFQQSGIILDSDNKTPIYIGRDTEETQIFKAGLGVSAYGALSLAYYLAPTWDLLIEPNVRIAPSSLTTSSYPLTQRFNTYGLSVGLRYRF